MERLSLCRGIWEDARKELEKEGGKEFAGRNVCGHDSIRADLEVEKIVAERVGEIASVLISEESGEIKGNGKEIVLCDPIDGSRNYRRGVQPYCIALSFSKTRDYKDIYFSYVRDFTSNDEFYATNEGTYGNGKRIRTSKKEELEDCVVEIDENRKGKYARFIPLLEKAKNGGGTGANILSLCYLARGSLDVFIDIRGTLPIVHVPGIHIAEKAGAVITDENRLPLSIELRMENRLSFISCANKQIHSKVLGIL